eukprot:6455318-Amphidinium_carterae.1
MNCSWIIKCYDHSKMLYEAFQEAFRHSQVIFIAVVWLAPSVGDHEFPLREEFVAPLTDSDLLANVVDEWDDLAGLMNAADGNETDDEDDANATSMYKHMCGHRVGPRTCWTTLDSATRLRHSENTKIVHLLLRHSRAQPHVPAYKVWTDGVTLLLLCPFASLKDPLAGAFIRLDPCAAFEDVGVGSVFQMCVEPESRFLSDAQLLTHMSARHTKWSAIHCQYSLGVHAVSGALQVEITDMADVTIDRPAAASRAVSVATVVKNLYALVPTRRRKQSKALPDPRPKRARLNASVPAPDAENAREDCDGPHLLKPPPNPKTTKITKIGFPKTSKIGQKWGPSQSKEADDQHETGSADSSDGGHDAAPDDCLTSIPSELNSTGMDSATEKRG